MSHRLTCLLLLSSSIAASPATQDLERSVELNVGETTQVQLSDQSTVALRLVRLEAERDPIRMAVRSAQAHIELDGRPLVVPAAMYHLPVTTGGIQIDCPITRDWLDNHQRENPWGLVKDARFRLWPAGSPLITPGTFGYPVRQRWFASDTQMANEPTFVNGDEYPGRTNIYYHYGLDFGGVEGLVEVLAATDGLVVSAADQTLPAYTNSPAKPRYDVIYVRDDRGWFYRYSHLARIDVKPGDRVRLGQVLGTLGKEGGSGGWAHLHFDLTKPQPSGQWGIEDAYAYVWQAWQMEARPDLIAVARPHHLVRAGDTVRLDASRSWAAQGHIQQTMWTFTDGTRAEGMLVSRRYPHLGTFAEMLEVTDARGARARDFAVVQVVDPRPTNAPPPTIHAAYQPTIGLRAGDEVTFKVRTFRTGREGETWDFGDGSPRVTVHSDGNDQVHSPEGYAVTTHRFERAGQYLVSVRHTNTAGQVAFGRLNVEVGEAFSPRTQVAIRGDRWLVKGSPLFAGTALEGLLPNVRMVNATFEDQRRPEFHPQTNTTRFLSALPDYLAQGVRAFTFNLQGGMPGYEGALNSAFGPDGRLRASYTERIRRVIEACDQAGAVVILGCFYQRQDQLLDGDDAVRRAVFETVRWIQRCRFQNVLLEIANEFDHSGFDHDILRRESGQVELIRLAKQAAPQLPVSTSGSGHGRFPETVANAADFLLIHFNGTRLDDIPMRIRALRKHGKPIVCNEDDRTGQAALEALRSCTQSRASYGLMLKEVNQYHPFEFRGADDDPTYYQGLRNLTNP